MNNRIKRHPVLSTSVFVMNTQMPSDDQQREIACLPLDMLNGWLFGVDAARVRPEIRDTLIQYQRECFAALAEYWQRGEPPAPTSPQKSQASHCLPIPHRIVMSFQGNTHVSTDLVPSDAMIVSPANLSNIISQPDLIHPHLLPDILKAASERILGHTTPNNHALTLTSEECHTLLLLTERLRNITQYTHDINVAAEQLNSSALSSVYNLLQESRRYQKNAADIISKLEAEHYRLVPPLPNVKTYHY